MSLQLPCCLIKVFYFYLLMHTAARLKKLESFQQIPVRRELLLAAAYAADGVCESVQLLKQYIFITTQAELQSAADASHFG